MQNMSNNKKKGRKVHPEDGEEKAEERGEEGRENEMEKGWKRGGRGRRRGWAAAKGRGEGGKEERRGFGELAARFLKTAFQLWSPGSAKVLGSYAPLLRAGCKGARTLPLCRHLAATGRKRKKKRKGRGKGKKKKGKDGK